MKSVIFTVTNDISYDQRMHRICRSLSKAGFRVKIVGRKMKGSIPLKEEPFEQHRISCRFEKGKLFYAEYNLRLLFYLLKEKADIIGAVDLDTLLPCYLVSIWKKKSLVFDAHEHFTEMIEVVNRPFTRNVWLMLEQWIVPKVKYAYTVSENLRQIFSEKYKVNFQLIRNIAELRTEQEMAPIGDPYFIYAGAVNEGRGLKECIEAMQYIPARLLVCGKGDLYDELVAYTRKLSLENKVNFLGYVPPAELQKYIQKAFAGTLLLENKGLSYYYSLANKFFDYMHAGIPQITIDFPEYRTINDTYQFALLVPLEVSAIADAANLLLTDRKLYDRLSSNARMARQSLNWEKEAEKLVSLYNQIQ